MKTNARIITSMSLILIGITSPEVYAATKKVPNKTVDYMCSGNNQLVSASYIYQDNTPMHVQLKIGKKGIYLNRNMDVAPHESGFRFTEALGYEWTTDAFNKSSASQANAHALRYGNDVILSNCSPMMRK